MTGTFRWAAVACCVVILLLTSTEILLRFLGVRFLLSYEYCGFLLAALVFFALPAITQRGEHITVAPVRPNTWLARTRRTFVLGLTIVYLAMLTYFCGLLTWTSYQDGARSQGIMLTPLYIPQSAMTLGIAVAALALIAKVLRGQRAEDREGSSP